jgi:hypothetical protein
MSTFLNSGPLIARQTIFVGFASGIALLLKIYLSINFGVSGIIWATVIGYGLFYILPTYRLAFSYLNNAKDINKI